MPTYMTHFGVRGKVIRYQGDWAKRADSMPDTYLREAQVLVLKGQIEVLEKISSEILGPRKDRDRYHLWLSCLVEH